MEEHASTHPSCDLHMTIMHPIRCDSPEAVPLQYHLLSECVIFPAMQFCHRCVRVLHRAQGRNCIVCHIWYEGVGISPLVYTVSHFPADCLVAVTINTDTYSHANCFEVALQLTHQMQNLLPISGQTVETAYFSYAWYTLTWMLSTVVALQMCSTLCFC